MDKSLTPTCLSVDKEFKYPSVLRLVCKLQMFVYAAVTMEFTTIFLNEFAFLLDPINTLLGGKNLYLGGCTNSWQMQ